MSTEDTITREQLAAAISAIVGAQSFVCIGDAQEAASTIFAAAERIAEPEYEPGEVYQDPTGRQWFRIRRGGAEWRSQAWAPVSRSEVIDTLGTFGMHEPVRRGKVADYIMVLLRGGQ